MAQPVSATKTTAKSGWPWARTVPTELVQNGCEKKDDDDGEHHRADGDPNQAAVVPLLFSHFSTPIVGENKDRAGTQSPNREHASSTAVLQPEQEKFFPQHVLIPRVFPGPRNKENDPNAASG